MTATHPDLILRGGHVIDPLNDLDGPADVAIADGRIVAVGPNLSTEGAARVLDVSGRYVTPGIIDMHAHVFHWHQRSRLSLDPHVNTFSAGVTTVVDAGTSGWKDFEVFKTKVIDTAKIRVLAFVNIVGQGMASGGLGSDFEHDAREMRPELAAVVAREYSDIVVGIKTAHYWARRPFDVEHLPWTAVERAVEAGDLCRKPVMVDFFPWLPERPYPTLILEKMRPGDIHTHVFAQQFPILDDAGKVNDFMFRARERGIIFDLGHGAASFWYRLAQPAIQQGFWPDSISTHLHTGNVNGPVFDMVTTMNKVLAMGVPLRDVIAMSTTAPAREIGHPELGHLSAGACADVAVFALDQGVFAFPDCGPANLTGRERLRAVLTLRAGRTVYNPHGLGLPEWPDAPPAYWVLR
ncbi:MAG: amidohydrolase/deacetylase family metallohydrolase [Thermomicrobiales bacterium]